MLHPVNPPPTSDDEKPKDDEVAPTRFRALIGRGHPEFSTGAQQDAQEYFGYLLEKLSRAERTATDPGHAVGDVSKLFEAQVESKLKCSQSGKVRYTTTSSSMFCMGIPVEAATNTAEVEAYIKEESAKRQKGEDVRGVVVVAGGRGLIPDTAPLLFLPLSFDLLRAPRLRPARPRVWSRASLLKPCWSGLPPTPSSTGGFPPPRVLPAPPSSARGSPRSRGT